MVSEATVRAAVRLGGGKPLDREDKEAHAELRRLRQNRAELVLRTEVPASATQTARAEPNDKRMRDTFAYCLRFATILYRGRVASISLVSTKDRLRGFSRARGRAEARKRLRRMLEDDDLCLELDAILVPFVPCPDRDDPEWGGLPWALDMAVSRALSRMMHPGAVISIMVEDKEKANAKD